MADESLDALLDGALEDFKLDPPTHTRSSEAPGTSEGLGKGLPPLRTMKKKTKPKTTAAAASAATLETLAEQTRNTVSNIGTQPDLSEEALTESLIKQFESLGAQDLDSVMGTFMQQLLSKEVLYEPMKEIAEKYPSWLEVNKARLSKEEYARFTKQHELIIKLCHAYESTPDDFPKILDVMQNMQSLGQPPADMVKELTGGLQLDENGMPMLPPLAGIPGMEGEKCSIM